MAATNADLARLIGQLESDIKWLIQDRAEENEVAKERHAENVENIQSVSTRVTALEGKVDDVAENVSTMLPTVRRLRARELFRSSLFRCLSRWRGIVVATGVSSGALYVWLDGHWPRIAALIRRLVGPG